VGQAEARSFWTVCFRTAVRIGNVAPESYVLDTSAIFALIENEEGADRVERILQEEHALLPWMTLLEVHYVTLQEQGQGEADRRYALMKQLPSKILWQIDEPILLTASRLKAGHHLSLADALVAAFAHHEGAVLVHKDPEFEVLSEQVKLEALPYKTGKESRA
jgi:predicted nucleic acid-binding protein